MSISGVDKLLKVGLRSQADGSTADFTIYTATGYRFFFYQSGNKILTVSEIKLLKSIRNSDIWEWNIERGRS